MKYSAINNECRSKRNPIMLNDDETRRAKKKADTNKQSLVVLWSSRRRPLQRKQIFN